jgi:exodeoxyribonuclease VII large subunit
MANDEEALQPDFGRDVYSISRLTREVRTVLEGSFPLLWVEGELSNLSQPASGHLYFSLKDEYAQVRCALFRMRRIQLRFRPANGLHVLARVRVSLYEGRGDFQLIVEHLEPAGEGALRLAFERLKQKLEAEGLFAAERKRPLPAFPRQVGLITSPSGAALRDLLSVLGRRFPALPVLIYPVPVQGEEAVPALVEALGIANRRAECDVLVIARGGGAMEDLWPFNAEPLARAIAASRIPVVTGIGHEIDFTIADFVADRRAPTPSVAAELVSPDRVELSRGLQVLRQRLLTAQGRRHAALVSRLGSLGRHLGLLHPQNRLHQQAQRLDDLVGRLRRQMEGRLALLGIGQRSLGGRLLAASPERRLGALRQSLEGLDRRVHQALSHRLSAQRQRLLRLVQTLDAVSPLGTLGRGYAILRRLPDGAILRDAAEVSPGDGVEALLQRGRLICRVESCDLPPEEG